MNEQEDIGWEAIRYVTGDLTEAEAKRFEQQLEDDQAAREAVAQAVELTQSITVIESEYNTGTYHSIPLDEDNRHQWRAGTTWIAMGTAICVAIAVAMFQLPRPKPTRTQSHPQHNATIGQLAITWSETHNALDNPLWPSEQLGPDARNTPIAETDLDIVDIELTAIDDSESWIHQAVGGLIRQTNDGEDNVMKEL